jgi:hypothetical protein
MEMTPDEVYKRLKKQNGESFAKVIRAELLLETPNIIQILEFAGNDPADATAIAPIVRELNKKKQNETITTNKNPLELLDMAGYDAFVVTNATQKNSIKKYFRPNEELCTFRDNSRHVDFYIIHAVKRGAEKILPKEKPEREDEYGTSVISIQIAKSGGFISIKNRYNHTVTSPDATFNNNPDNIIPGLSNALKQYFNIDFYSSENVLPDNYRVIHERFVRFNYEVENTYFGPDFYFKGSEVVKLNNDYQYMLDYFVLDLKQGLLNPSGVQEDSFGVLQKIFAGKKITVKTNPENKKEKLFYADGQYVLTTNGGQIVSLNIPNVKKIENNFLKYNTVLTELSVPDLIEVGDDFLYYNKVLFNLDTPNLKKVGGNFLCSNTNMTALSLQELDNVGDYFLSSNRKISQVDLPKLKSVGNKFLYYNTHLTQLDLPSLETAGDSFVSIKSDTLTTVNVPNLVSAGKDFLENKPHLKHLEAPKLRTVDDGFLAWVYDMQTLNLPMLETVGNSFMSQALFLTYLDVPQLRTVGNDFLYTNQWLKHLYAPKLEKVGDYFLFENVSLETLALPALKKVGSSFLNHNNSLHSLSLPALTSVSGQNSFLASNKVLTEFDAPKMKFLALVLYLRIKFMVASNKAKIKGANTNKQQPEKSNTR